MKTDILYDQYRITGRWSSHVSLKLLIRKRSFRKIYYFRKLQETHGIEHMLFHVLSFLLQKKISLEIPRTIKLGKGFNILHPYSITINGSSEIGENFTILKGATIGESKTGKIGAPVIGNNVYVGLNSTVVGGIKIGNDVMIAANTFVNFDVPDGALVIGSPGIIHKKDKASQPYISNSILNIETERCK